MFAAKDLFATRGGYNIAKSLRFRSSASAYLSRTPGSAGNRKTWTWSGWVKRGSLGAAQMLFIGYVDINNKTRIDISSGDVLRVYDITGGSTERVKVNTTQVFRDPSAWYHIVVVIDTTSATSTVTGSSTDRVRIYINGSQVSSFSSSVAPAQNTDLYVNATNAHAIGGSPPDSIYLDGYLSEVNFIDGQALTPSSFGAFDTNGVWQPAKYTGSYGTNGFYLPFTPNTTSTYALYQPSIITDYIGFPTGNQGTNFTFSGDFTIEGWVYFTSASSGDNSFYVQSDGGGTNYLAFNISMTAGIYNIYLNSPSVSNTISHGLTANTWNHVAMVRSGSTITLYTNGVSKGTITNSATLGYSTLTVNRIGGGAGGARYTSNFRITKSAVYTSAFTPPTSPLTAVANTVILTCQNSTAVDNSGNSYSTSIAGSATLGVQYPFGGPNVVGNDASGVGNNWTSNNISLATGTTYDSMIDSPTNYADGGNGRGNYCVLNPLDNSNNTLSDGNLTAVLLGWPGGSNPNGNVAGSIAVTSGKYYWEATITASSGNGAGLGVARGADGITGYTSSGVYYLATGNKQIDGGTATAYGATYAANDVIGIALDADGGTITFYKQTGGTGSFTSQGSITLPSSTSGWKPKFGNTSATGGNNWTIAFNAGQRPYNNSSVPSGYTALNTQNLPTPTIAAGNKYFDATTYTGDGAASGRNISLNFSPDLMWIKSRSLTTGYHFLFDGVRGATKVLGSSQTAAEYTNGDLGLGTNQFTIGDNGGLDEYNPNKNTATYVAWGWAANGSGSSNTSGSITSTVSANVTAGFSIVRYTGTGSAATVGHGLGVKPSLIIPKSRSNVTNWESYHSALGATKYVALNLTNAAATSSTPWNNTEPTSSVFTVGTSDGTNFSGYTYVAYCFAEVAGYSKFGSYTGNGSADGPFVYCGFRPRYVMIKRATGTTGGSDWLVYDTARNAYNLADLFLKPNTSDAESSGSTNNPMDILSNGFKLRWSTASSNASGETFIYAAFAETPMNFARAR